MEDTKKMKYFMDFDDTLFNRNLYVKRLFAFLKGLGFSEDESLQAYKAVYEAGYQGILPHLDKLSELYPEKLSQEALTKAKEGVYDYLHENLDMYRFPETEKFLSSIDRNKYDIYLITVGGKDFQKAKVEDSGTAKFFPEGHVIYTDSANKEDVLGQYVQKGERFILLDDKQYTLDQVKERFPEAIVLPAGGGDLLKYLDPESSVPKEGEKIADPVQPEAEIADPSAQPSISDLNNNQSMSSEPDDYTPAVR